MGMESISKIKIIYEKLFQFIGNNVYTIDQTEQDTFSIRQKREFVYFVKDNLIRRASCIRKDNLISLGTCIGKFSRSGRFRLTIGVIDLLVQNSKNKVWLGCKSELKFIYE